MDISIIADVNQYVSFKEASEVYTVTTATRRQYMLELILISTQMNVKYKPPMGFVDSQ